MGKAVFLLSVVLIFSAGSAVYSASFKDAVEAREEEEKKRREDEDKKGQETDRGRDMDRGSGDRDRRDSDRNDRNDRRDSDRRDRGRRDRGRRNRNRNRNYYYDDDDDGSAALFMIQLWALNNFSSYYGHYPYESGGYIRYASASVSMDADEADLPEDNPSRKFFWFNTSVAGLYFGDMGFGSWISFSGNIFKFFGPYVDVYYLNGEEMIGSRAGLHFSLIQTNPFNMSLYFQAQWQFIDPDWDRAAVVGGLEFRLYPVKPLSLRLKLGGQVFEYFRIGEIEAEAGVLLQAWEIFGGWRWWNMEGGPGWNGPYLGVRRYF